MHEQNLTSNSKLHVKLIGIFSIFIILYGIAYGSRLIFPQELYSSKINKLFESRIIKEEVTVRTPTGWLSDNATQCLSLGVGFVSHKSPSDVFLDLYNNPKNEYNPCKGLSIESVFSNGETQVSNYSRYWHGHAILTQWMILLIGFPSLVNSLWLINLTLLFLVGSEFLKPREQKLDKKILIGLILPYLAFADFADLHTSITHLLVSIFTLFTSLIFVRNIGSNSSDLKQIGFCLGSLYSFFLFGLSPQSVPIIIISWCGIYLILTVSKKRVIINKLISFLGYWIIGYALTFISKWIIVALLTDYPIFNDAKKQFLYRASHSSASLSSGVREHLRFADSLPAFLQSWVANVATFLIHISDPRYASILIQVLVGVVLLILFMLPSFFLFSFPKKQKSNLKSILALNLASFTIIFGWYAFLAQHSYDHATYTFRSLVFWFGGFVASLIYLFNCSKIEWCARRDSNPKPSDP